jgi:hypothetical protein
MRVRCAFNSIRQPQKWLRSGTKRLRASLRQHNDQRSGEGAED